MGHKENQKKYYLSLKVKGFVRKSIIVKREHWEKIKAFIDSLSS